MTGQNQLHVTTVEAPGWYAVLVMEKRPRLDPDIICIGFRTAKERDDWLGYFAPAVRNLASMMPLPWHRRRRRPADA